MAKSVSRPRVPTEVESLTTSLLVIDMQRCYVQRGAELDVTFDEDDAHRDYYFGRLEQTVIPNCSLLVRTFRERGRPVYFITFGTASADGRDLSARRRRRSTLLIEQFGVRLPPVIGSSGHAIIPELAPAVDEQVLNKLSTSAFNTTALSWHLHQNKIDSVVVVGVGTSGCVEGTARDAVDLGFECVVVDDATANFDEASHVAALSNFQQLFGDVWTSKRVIEMLGEP